MLVDRHHDTERRGWWDAGRKGGAVFALEAKEASPVDVGPIQEVDHEVSKQLNHEAVAPGAARRRA